MEKYAVSVELVYYHTIYVEADSEQEAVAKAMDFDELTTNYKARIYDKEYDFTSVEYDFDSIDLIVTEKISE
jgi:hypothetical protein